MGTFGRAGSGPGEYDLVLSQFYRDKTGTVSVIDAFQLRRTIVDHIGEPVSSHPLPGPHLGYFEIAGVPHFQTPIRGPDGVVRLLHRLAEDGSVVSSHYELAPGPTTTQPYRARVPTDSGVWLAQRTRYELELLDRDLRSVRTVTPPAGWFTPHSVDMVDFRAERPEPIIVAMTEGEGGLLWLIILAADKEWKASTQKGEQRSTPGQTARYVDWIIEAVDPTTGERIAHLRRDWPVMFGNGDQLLYEISEGAFGQGVLTVSRMRLEGR